MCAFTLRHLINSMFTFLQFSSTPLLIQEAALCVVLLHFKEEDMFVYRHTAT